MTTGEVIIKNKVGLLHLAEMLGNVSQACKVMGYSRHSFYRFKEMYDQGGEKLTMVTKRIVPHRGSRIRVEPLIEEAVVSMAIERPAYGQLRASNELKKGGFFYLPRRGAQCVVTSRYGDVPETTPTPGSQGGSRATEPDRGSTSGLRKSQKRSINPRVK